MRGVVDQGGTHFSRYIFGRDHVRGSPHRRRGGIGVWEASVGYQPRDGQRRPSRPAVSSLSANGPRLAHRAARMARAAGVIGEYHGGGIFEQAAQTSLPPSDGQRNLLTAPRLRPRHSPGPAHQTSKDPVLRHEQTE